MFGFLKDKLKSALGKLTKEVEKDAVVEKKEVIVEKPKEEKKPETKKKEEPKKSSPVKPEQKIKKPELVKEKAETRKEEKVKEEPKKEAKVEQPTPEPEKKQGFFSKLFSRKEDKKEEIQTEQIVLQSKTEKISDAEDILDKKEQLQAVAEKTDIEPVDVKKLEVEEKPIKKIIKKEKIKIEAEPEQEKESIKEIIEEPKIEAPKEEKIQSTPVAPEIKEKPKPQHKIIEEERSTKVIEQKEESKGFFSKITETFTKIQISEDKFEELFWDLEVALLENGVAVEVIDKIKRDLKKELMSGKVSRTGVEELIIATLKKSIIELFDVEKRDLVAEIKAKKNKPYVVSIIGVNGSGKTTSIAKLAHKLQKEGLTVVLAASDTFRAAAIQQLEEHAKNLNIKIVKHDYNSDPAAVAFDAINYAKAKNIDVVLIDTAGRLHSNTNLMRELEKIIRVCNPDIKIFVGESITGNDCVEQAKEFDSAVGINAIILAKADVDDKGGAAISVSYILKQPILYLGTGQAYDDLKEFDSNLIIESLGL